MAVDDRGVGRNDDCPCGSGRKFKKCHGAPFGSKDGLSAEAGRLVRVTSADHAVVIMAGGAGSRWVSSLDQDSGTSPITDKLLVPISGRPLLHRTLDQLSRSGISSTIIYNQNMPLPVGHKRFFPPQHKDSIVGALGECRNLWDKNVLILLGDVVWSNAGLARVLESHPVSWRFFGKRGANKYTGKKWGEIYALRFNVKSAPQVGNAIDLLMHPKAWRRKLWDLYRVMLGEPVVTEKPADGDIMNPPASMNFCEIADFTDDVDSLNDYNNLLAYFQRRPKALKE